VNAQRPIPKPLAPLLAAVLCLGTASAAPPAIRLTEHGCSAYDRARLDELIAIELETVESDRPARPSDVALECSAGVVSIRASLRGTSRERKSRVDPKAMDPAAATRLLALAITELLAQLWSEAEPARPPPVPAARPAEPQDVPAPLTVAHEREFAVFAGAAFRTMLEPRAGLFGGALRAEYDPVPWLGLGLDLEVADGSVQSSHADVDVLLGSAALYAPIGARLGRTALGAGPGVRMGWVELSPTRLEPGATGRDVSGAWGGPLLMARALWTNNALALCSGLEAGLVTLPVVGTLNGEAAEVEVRGVWVAASLSVGANL